LLYEVYDPAAEKNLQKSSKQNQPDHSTGMQVLTSIEFLQAGIKVFETPLVQANQLNVPTRNAVAFAFDVPLDQLKPGAYICQVNVIDDTGGSFIFPRQSLLIREARGEQASPTPAAAPAGQ
jgi:hypothetical protein